MTTRGSGSSPTTAPYPVPARRGTVEITEKGVGPMILSQLVDADELAGLSPEAGIR